MKMSSYQKLKEENKRLRNEINILVNEPKSSRAIELQIIFSRPKIMPIQSILEKSIKIPVPYDTNL